MSARTILDALTGRGQRAATLRAEVVRASSGLAQLRAGSETLAAAYDPATLPLKPGDMVTVSVPPGQPGQAQVLARFPGGRAAAGGGRVV